MWDIRFALINNLGTNKPNIPKGALIQTLTEFVCARRSISLTSLKFRTAKPTAVPCGTDFVLYNLQH